MRGTLPGLVSMTASPTSTLALYSTFFFILPCTVVPMLSKLQKKRKLSNRLKLLASLRKPRKRILWSREKLRYSERLFLRLFRMELDCFNELLARIEEAVGPEEFKSELYLEDLRKQGTLSAKGRMCYASSHTTGEYISGEWKVALTLRHLAGCTYLDLFLWSNIAPNYCRAIVNGVIKNWICNNDVISIDFYENVLNDPQKIKEIGEEFGGKTQGIFNGCIGALDGWIVKIFCPTISEVPNPGKYYSRKGSFAINVQVIVDMKKRVLWRHIGEMGSSHDSPIFHESKLGKFMEDNAETFKQKGIFLVGDSAYSLRSYLMTPYNNPGSKSAQDNFNYFLSSCRIFVECCFGEVDRCWGILWRPLVGKLKNHKNTIDACLRLHNFIVDYRETKKIRVQLGDGEVNENIMNEQEELDVASDIFLRSNPFHAFGSHANESTIDELAQRGRRSNRVTMLTNEGKEFRDNLCQELEAEGMARPIRNRLMRRDRHYRPTEE